MFAQCPQCESIFRVSDAQIAAANGLVRCGQCLGIFNALEHARDDLRTRNTAHNAHGLTTPAVAPQQPVESWPDDQPLFDHEPMYALEDTQENSDSVLQAASRDRLSEPLSDTVSETVNDVVGAGATAAQPSKATIATPAEIPTVILQDLEDARAARARPSNIPWLLGSMLLVLALAAQAIYLQRDALGRDPRLRPWLEQACGFLGCQLATPLDIKQIELIGLDVHTHAETPDALVASTAIINRAGFTQPYPLLTLVFSDITGSRVAQRRFLPEEYLPPQLKLQDGMVPNLPIKIELELMDPGAEAVNFEFQLLSDPRQLHTAFK